MNKKIRELFSGVGMVVTAFLMMTAVAGLIYVAHQIFSPHK
jgi:uncharacterized iron-regulated membrane protein